jgi:hypothetical protein
MKFGIMPSPGLKLSSHRIIFVPEIIPYGGEIGWAGGSSFLWSYYINESHEDGVA